MKKFTKISLIVSLFALLAVLAVPASASDTTTTKTVTIQESAINSSYWVTNPAWRSVTDRSVDLQPGQVVVSETITRRGHDPVAVVITYTPYISDGRIYWTAAAVTADGNLVSADFLKEINDHMTASWAHYIRSHRLPGHVTSIDIGDTAITITGTVAVTTAHPAH